MSIEQQVARAAHGIATEVSPPLVDVGMLRDRARSRRRRTAVAQIGAVAVVVSAVVALVVARAPEPVPPEPVRPPGIIVGEVPVWYDAAGLHRGDVVEETAVRLYEHEGEGGVLTLVRRGALYRDPATDDVWFQPWGDQPRVVGHGSFEGPSGDPNSDVAAWFEGSELVLYDTALGREISRTRQHEPACTWAAREALDGNGFKHVSPTEVVWRACGSSPRGMWRFDVASGRSTRMREVSPDRDVARVDLADVHDDVRVFAYMDGRELSLMVRTLAGGVRNYVAQLPGRLSPDGAFVLSRLGTLDGRNPAAMVVDTRTGAEWQMREEYPDSVSWSYGHVALVFFDPQYRRGGLRACHVITHECERLTYDGVILLPQS